MKPARSAGGAQIGARATTLLPNPGGMNEMTIGPMRVSLRRARLCDRLLEDPAG